MSPGFYSFESALTCFTGCSIYSRTSSGPTHPLPGPGECRCRRGHRDQGVVGLAPGTRASTDSGIKSWTGLASACQVGPRSGQASLPCHGVRLVSCWPQGQERRVFQRWLCFQKLTAVTAAWSWVGWRWGLQGTSEEAAETQESGDGDLTGDSFCAQPRALSRTSFFSQ